MQDNKLIHILRSLSRKEMTRLVEFAHSPYFNKHEGVQQLLAYLGRVYPQFDEKHCERKKVFGMLFPDQAHDQAQLAIVFTYAFRLTQQFLQIEQGASEPNARHLQLLKQYRLRNLLQLYEKQLNAATQALEHDPVLDIDSYSWRYQLAAEADGYFTATAGRRRDDNLELKHRYLDRFYIAQKLRDACEMQVRSQILKVEFHNPLFKAIVAEVEQNLAAYTDDPPVLVYFKLFEMIGQNDNSRYFDALNTLKTNEHHFSADALKPIYNYFQNYCIRQINKGEELFLSEIFKLYQTQLEKGLILEEGLLSEWHYKNIVTTALRLREMDWVKNFIEVYREHLHPDVRDNAYRFNLASYYYATQQYTEVLHLLIQVEYSDMRYNLGAKALLLRTYYDLDEYDALCSLADSFKQYLLRNKLMADVRRQGYHNLFKFTRRAAAIRLNLDFIRREKSRQELDKLERQIQKTDDIFNKGWLVEKVAGLKGRV